MSAANALIDSHSHIDVDAFDADRDAVLLRATQVGVAQHIVPAIQFDTWPSLKAVCTQHPGLFPAYGLHPMYLDAHRPEHLTALPDWIAGEGPVAVGECGLDYFVEGLDRHAQQFYFRRQLEIAREFDLPVIVHARRALDDVIAVIRTIGRLRGVIHSFSGSIEQARQLWRMGFHLGIGGPVTYERASRIRAVVTTMPLDQLLLETDAPDQPLSGRQGQRNEPAHLPEVARCVAMLRGVDVGVVAAATTRNATELFGLARGAEIGTCRVG